MDSELVYSTGLGRIRPVRETPEVPKSSGIVKVSRETHGRKGKCVTLVSGVPLRGEALLELTRALKQKCGAGGTVKDGVIEIQGDQRERVFEELVGQGFTVKEAGG